MRISDKLHFEPVGNSICRPVCCYNCGREDLPRDWLIARIFPFEDGTDLNFVVCSDRCRQAVISHEQLDVQIMLDVVQAAQQHNKLLRPDYKKILLSISN